MGTQKALIFVSAYRSASEKPGSSNGISNSPIAQRVIKPECGMEEQSDNLELALEFKTMPNTNLLSSILNIICY